MEKVNLDLMKTTNRGYTFELITKDIAEVVNYLSIKKSHFVGVSLGTIIIRDFLLIDIQI